MKKSLIIELILFIVLMTILTILGVKVFKNTFDIGTTYHVNFQDINGIVIGSPVRILGVDIGHVTKVKPEYDTIKIDFIVTDDKIKIPDGTHITISSFGIAGSRSLELTPPEKGSSEKGIVVDEPFRLGYSLSILEKFMRAAMSTVGGLFEFAKGRSQSNVQDVTNKIVSSTIKTSHNLSDLTAKVEKGGNTTRNNINRTTTGMTKVYDEIAVFNFSKNVVISKYAINLSRRTLIKFHRDIQDFNRNTDYYADFVNTNCSAIRNLGTTIQGIEGLYNTTNGLVTTLDKVNQNFTCERINKLYKNMNNIKNKTQNLQKSI